MNVSAIQRRANTPFSSGSKLESPALDSSNVGRRVFITWLNNTVMQAMIIRPGIAVAAETQYLQSLYEHLGPPLEWTPIDTELESVEFCGELDDLLKRIEGIPSDRSTMGRTLVNFFGRSHLIPRDDGTITGSYDPDTPNFDIMGRRLEAFFAETGGTPDKGHPAEINCIIIQNNCRDDRARTVNDWAAENGLGAFAIIEFYTRSLYLIDEQALPPELLLAHELIHAAHIVAGSVQQERSTVAARWGEDETAFARALFNARTKIGSEEVERYIRDKEAYERLEVEQQLEIDAHWKDLVRLRELAVNMIEFPVPSRKAAIALPGLYYQDLAEYEEAVTVGNDVCKIWLNWKLGWENIPLMGADLTAGSVRSNNSAQENLGRVEKFRWRVGYRREKRRACETAEQRQISHNFTEISLAIEMSIQPRASHIPTLSRKLPVTQWKHRQEVLSFPRSRISGVVFQDRPLERLLEWLDNNGYQNSNLRQVVMEYRNDLANWSRRVGGRSGDYRQPPRSCMRQNALLGVTVDPVLVPNFIKDRALAIVDDLTRHPDLANTVSFNNIRLYRASPRTVPLIQG